MTLELNKIAPQVEQMGAHLAQRSGEQDRLLTTVRAILAAVSTEFDDLEARVQQAEAVQEGQRFSWLGAAPAAPPANEALAEFYPPPPLPEQVTVIASDGSQIYPDQHAIALYYLINIGAIVYRHGSGLRPDTITRGELFFGEEVVDERGFLIPASYVNVQRDVAELAILAELAAKQPPAHNEPLITLIDGRLPLRVLELSGREQNEYLSRYLQHLKHLQDKNATIAAVIDRPRSGFVISLLHLAQLDAARITEEALRHNPFAQLTDGQLFANLPAGHRTAIFNQRAKANIDYANSGHAIHFFYLNTGTSTQPTLSRVEIPAWVAQDSARLNALHATLLHQSSLARGYPYVLARAHELAIVSPAEREALDTMLGISLRKHGLKAAASSKQQNKNALSG